MTNNSAEDSGPSALRASPGASAITRVSSRPKPLTISLSAPLRRIIAELGEAEEAIALRKPAAIERTPTRTPTTPAMPITAAMTEPRRCGMPIKPNLVTAPTCESQLMGPDILHSPQRVGDAQAHRAHRREDPSQHAQQQTNARSQKNIPRWQ